MAQEVTLEPLRQLAAEAGCGRTEFSPDGKFVAAHGPDSRLRVWSVEVGRLLGVFWIQSKDLASGVQAFAWAPDGRSLVATGFGKSEGGVVTFLDPATGKVLRSFAVASPFSRSLQFPRIAN